MALVFNTPKSALNTTSKDIQNLSSDCPPCPEVNLTTADVEYTENGSFTVTPESGFDGLSQVDVTVNIDTQSIADEAYAEGEAAGIVTGKAQGVAEQKAKLTSTTITQNGTSTREDGWNSVTVNVQPTLQSKTINPATVIQGVQADAGYDGLSNVTVNAVTSAIDSNIQPENILEGITILGVEGTDQGYATGFEEGQASCPTCNTHYLSETITENGVYEFNPNEYCADGAEDPETGECTVNADVFNSAYIEVNVPSCPDWSSIGWDCNDVENSSLAADIAYTAQKKAEYEAGTISNFSNDTNLKWMPKITLPSDSSDLFSNCKNITETPSSFDGQPTNVDRLFYGVPLQQQPEFDWSEITSASETFWRNIYGKGVDFNPVVNAPKCTNMQYCFSSFANNQNASKMTTATVNAPLVTNAYYMFSGNSNLTTVNLTLGELTNCSNMFENCSSLSAAPQLQFSSEGTSIVRMFRNCTALTQIPNYDYTKLRKNGWYDSNQSNCPFSGTSITTIPDLTIGFTNHSSVEWFGFTKMNNLTTIGNITFDDSNFVLCEFTGSPNITTIGGLTNFGSIVSGHTSTRLDLTPLTQLTKQSILNIFNTIANKAGSSYTGKIQLSAESYALLTAEDIAIATAKNWTVTSA